MALLFADGFDIYTDSSQVTQNNWTRNNTEASGHAWHATDGRFGGGCLKGSTAQYWEIGAHVAVGDTVIVGWSYWHDGNGGATDLVIQGTDQNNARLFALRHNTAGDLQALNQLGSQVGSTASAVLAPNSWNWIEIKVVLGAGAANGSIDVNVNGVNVITAATIDTNNGNPLRRVQFFGSLGLWRIDDVIVMDGSGSFMNDFIGDSRIQALIPNGDGGTTDWTGGFADVDDAIGAVDDASTLIESSTVAQESRFTMTNLVDDPTTIHAVQVRARARKEDVGLRTLRGLINSGGTEATGPERGLSTDWVWQRLGAFYVDPDTTLAWDKAGVDALEAGVEVVQ